MTEKSDAVGAAEQILKETKPDDEARFGVSLPRKLVQKLSRRFEIGRGLGDMVANDLVDDQQLSDEQKEKWQKLVQGRHDDMQQILGKRFKEALLDRSSIGLVRVNISFREIDFLGRYRKGITEDDFKEIDIDDIDVLRGRKLMGYGTPEEEAEDFLGINGTFVKAGGRDNTELRTFYEELLGRRS